MLTLRNAFALPETQIRQLAIDRTMIPNFNHSHVLPPFLGNSPSQAAQASPYTTTANELVARLGHTPQRCVLLKGLFAYRQALIDLGFSHVLRPSKSEGRKPLTPRVLSGRS